MAEGQAAQGFVRNLFFPARPSRQGAGWGGELGPRSLRYTPVLRELNFWKVSLAQYQWKTASVFSRLIPPVPKQLGQRRQSDLATDNPPARRRRLNGKAIERGGRGWGGQSQCASPAREDRGNLTRLVATNSESNVNVQTPRRRSQQHTPKSRKE
jgi:hypothetical protein